MQRTITSTVLAAASVLGGVAIAAPATADTDPSDYTNQRTSSQTVAHGTIDGLRGNRHQVRLYTWEGKVMNSRVRSYYCPSGATITPTWISSKCVLRSTYSLTNFRQNNETSHIGRVSSTGRSATQIAPVLAKNSSTGKSLVLGSDIKLYSRVDGDGVGYVSVSGTFGGRGFGEQRLGDFGTPN